PHPYPHATSAAKPPNHRRKRILIEYGRPAAFPSRAPGPAGAPPARSAAQNAPTTPNVGTTRRSSRVTPKMGRSRREGGRDGLDAAAGAGGPSVFHARAA